MAGRKRRKPDGVAGFIADAISDAARSQATDPAATSAEPAAILGLRRCTARAARRT
jgi:hypothetical protein